MQIVMSGSSGHEFFYEESKNDSENMLKPTLSINPEILPFLFERRKSHNHKYVRLLIDSHSPPPKIRSIEEGNFNLHLRYVTASEIKMRALNSMDNENLVYGYS